MSNPFETQAAGLPPQIVQMTLQADLVCHYIRDDELERLGEVSSDPVKDIFLLSAGVAAGAIIPALEALSQFNHAKDPMDVWGLITVLVLVAAVGITIVTCALWRYRAKGKWNLVSSIRGRPKVNVQINRS